MRNPRSTKTTGIFSFKSFDSFDQLIDVYSESNTAVTMTRPLAFTTAEIVHISSLSVSQAQVEYTFQLSITMPLQKGDYIILGMPEGGEI